MSGRLILTGDLTVGNLQDMFQERNGYRLPFRPASVIVSEVNIHHMRGGEKVTLEEVVAWASCDVEIPYPSLPCPD